MAQGLRAPPSAWLIGSNRTMDARAYKAVGAGREPARWGKRLRGGAALEELGGVAENLLAAALDEVREPEPEKVR